MKTRTRLIAAALAAAGTVSAVQAETLKFAFQGELNALDPYSLNETFTLSALGNTYEGLTRRGADLQIEPSLAERWEIIGPNRWRFFLRKGVKFHNGSDFTAEDVAFSVDRVRSDGSNLNTRVPADAKVEIVDDHTVDFVLSGPNPILHYEWDTFYIMDKEWTTENDAVSVTSASDTAANHAALNANGTGPFKLVSHEAGVKTVYEKFDDWWDTATHNLDTVEFTPIGSDATRVAALLSGEMDMVYPIPVQDIKRINDNNGTVALTGPELRTIFLGMDQFRDKLLYSDVKDANPFKDARVRKAFYQAIDIEAIRQKVMRTLSTPSAIMISPFLFSKAGDFERYPYDPDGAKALLAEAGYPDGFSVGMDCPNDRYVNDESICQAVAAMLARVGVKVDLNAQPKAKYFAKILASGGYDTSFYLLGWTPGSFDSWNILDNLMNCRDESGDGSPFNNGGFCDERIDELTDQVLVEIDPKKRDDLIAEAYAISHENAYYIPLHQQGLAWGVSDSVNVVQRADNQFMFRFVTKN